MTMVTMLVGQCHVFDSNREVLRHVVEPMKPGAWESLPKRQKFAIIRAVIQAHTANRRLYHAVYSGTSRP